MHKKGHAAFIRGFRYALGRMPERASAGVRQSSLPPAGYSLKTRAKI